MEIGAFIEPETQTEVQQCWDLEQLGAITTSTQCHKCGGWGHIASQCPTVSAKG